MSYSIFIEQGADIEQIGGFKSVVKKRQPIKARQMQKAFVVGDDARQSGRGVRGLPGDYLLQTAGGTFHVCPKEQFEKLYEAV